MPAVCRILETIRVVVVLPLVPVTAADPRGNHRESFVRTFGSILRATTPGTVEPPPVLSVRLASCADRAASIAAERRRSGKVLTARIICTRATLRASLNEQLPDLDAHPG
jgi:hypothetical protein